MIILEPKSGNIGTIKAPHAAKATGVTLLVPEIEPIFHRLKELESLVCAGMTGKFDYKWEYDQQDESYRLLVNYYQGMVEYAIKFPKEKSGQILQKLVEQEQYVVTMVLKYQEGAQGYFDDAVVLMGMELEILPEAGWPVVG